MIESLNQLELDYCNDSDYKDNLAFADTVDRAIYENRSDNSFTFIDYYPSSLYFNNNWSSTWELRSIYFGMVDEYNNYYMVRIYQAIHRVDCNVRYTTFYDTVNRKWDGWVYWEDT